MYGIFRKVNEYDPLNLFQDARTASVKYLRFGSLANPQMEPVIEPKPEKVNEYYQQKLLGQTKRSVMCADGKVYTEGHIMTTIDGEYALSDIGGKPFWVKLDKEKRTINEFNGDVYKTVSRLDFEEPIIPGFKFLD
jgi:hypothetical protein